MAVDPIKAISPASAITATEPLTRYVTDRENLKPTLEGVFWRAFHPTPTDRELSVARIDGLSIPGIWTLGDTLAGGPSQRTVYGRADFDRTRARGIPVANGALDVIPDDPPARHAIIVGWPGDREERKTVSMRLAAVAQKHIR